MEHRAVEVQPSPPERPIIVMQERRAISPPGAPLSVLVTGLSCHRVDVERSGLFGTRTTSTRSRFCGMPLGAG